MNASDRRVNAMVPTRCRQLMAFAVACGVMRAGCAIAAAPAAPVTFARDVAPIIFDRCGVCHHPNGSAPFSLLTYPAVRQRATQIAAVTKSRVMPPWKAEPGYGDFVGQRPLSAGEIDLVQRWLADGALEGDPRELPPPPRWSDG